MDTSDDPINIGQDVFKSIGGLFEGDGDALPSRTAEQPTKTAEPVDQLSEQARKNRRRSAGLFSQGFAPPQLSTPGLLG